ncbi:MAG: GNAT family N-acetyltransferase [Actinobacteria bacterium]|nr:GNAT family N-acetyltransferase [Actinomycetota bacterium]
MALVDLRGREDEPAVRALLACAHGSAPSVDRAAARYRTGEWVLIGWEEGGALVACAGVERGASGDIAMRSVAVVPERRGQGSGRALVDAVAGAATARRLVAETDEDAVGFYRNCGFSVERIEPRAGRARFRCARTIEPPAGSTAAVSAFTLGELERAIEESWGADTSDDPGEWSEVNPARGQCAVTSVLVRDLLGGEILIAGVLRDGERVERHAWNRLPSGLSLDLTRSQFRGGEELEEPEAGEPILADRVRCELLAERVRARLGGVT